MIFVDCIADFQSNHIFYKFDQRIIDIYFVNT